MKRMMEIMMAKSINVWITSKKSWLPSASTWEIRRILLGKRGCLSLWILSNKNITGSRVAMTTSIKKNGTRKQSNRQTFDLSIKKYHKLLRKLNNSVILTFCFGGDCRRLGWG